MELGVEVCERGWLDLNVALVAQSIVDIERVHRVAARVRRHPRLRHAQELDLSRPRRQLDGARLQPGFLVLRCSTLEPDTDGSDASMLQVSIRHRSETLRPDTA
eukprot:3935407-Rhodomonas_salina.4